MKKVNSIGYGHKILGCAACCVIVGPMLGGVLWRTTKQVQFRLLSKASLIVGIIIFLFLFILIKVELYQDRKINAYYKDNACSCIPLQNGLFECQACGNHQVKAGQRMCTVCGTNFKNRSEEHARKKHR